MRTWTWYSKLLFALALFAFAYWVWPTPWRYFNADGEPWRQQRISGRTQVFNGTAGWRP